MCCFRLRHSDLFLRVLRPPQTPLQQHRRRRHLGHVGSLLQGCRGHSRSQGEIQVRTVNTVAPAAQLERKRVLDGTAWCFFLTFPHRKQSCYFLHHKNSDSDLRGVPKLGVEDHLRSDPNCTVAQACACAVELIVIYEEASMEEHEY